MKHVRQISNLLARVAKIMNLRWLKDTYIICSYNRGYWIKWQKKSQKDTVYFQPEDNHGKKYSQREKVKKNITSSNTSLKWLFFLSEDVETLGKNGGASTSILAHSPKSKLSIMLDRI